MTNEEAAVILNEQPGFWVYPDGRVHLACSVEIDGKRVHMIEVPDIHEAILYD